MRLPAHFTLSLFASSVGITLLHLLGLYVFLEGFLLTRHTLSFKGRTYDTWERFPLLSHPTAYIPLNLHVPERPPFKRVVIILIDALRFDFLLDLPTTPPQHYLNQLPILQHLHKTQPASSLLFQFRADPPTTTTQRVKGLMTGSLPTFIDAGSNFASSAVGEDHLLHHLSQHYKEIYFMGDDTWVQLFPDTFYRPNYTFSSDSFKMFDLDTVDRRILSHLWPLIENKNTKDDKEKEGWEVVIAHFLGVDHCGHTHGPSHPNMARKLSEMNTVLERLLQQVDNETLLVVMGDHGMSVEGDHGGESVEELMSGLFLYSQRPLTLAEGPNTTAADRDYYRGLFHRIHHARADLLGYDFELIKKRLGYDATQPYPIVSQIHLVPTLAYLLKLPIPFGNLGGIIPDILFPDTASKVDILVHMVQKYRTNALQIYDYVLAYGEHAHHPGFSPQTLGPILKSLYDADALLLTKASTLSSHLTMTTQEREETVEILERALLSYDTFIISTIKYCEGIWAQFDVGCMAIGIAILFATLVAHVWLIQRPSTTGILFVSTWVGGCAGCLGLVVARYTVLQDLVHRYEWFGKMDWLSWIGVCCAFATLLSLFSMRRLLRVTAGWVRWGGLVLLCLLQALALGSNSFVVWEDRSVRFIAATLCCGWALVELSLQKNSVKEQCQCLLGPLLVLVVVRGMGWVGQCREEQFPYCTYLHNGHLKLDSLGSVEGYGTLAWILLSCILVFYLSRLYQHYAINNGIASTVLLKMYWISLGVVLLRQWDAIYQNSPETMAATAEKYPLLAILQNMQFIRKSIDVYLPRVVYGVCGLGTAVSLTLLKKNRTLHAAQFKRTAWALLCLWSAGLAMLQRPLGSLVMFIFPLLVQCMEQGHSQSLPIRLYLMHTLGHQLFFSTAHQATFTSLPWKAAFIGFDDMNYYGGMILVALSTMSGYVVSWLGWLVLLSSTVLADPSTHPLVRSCLLFLPLLQSIPTCFSALFVMILRRHLMTWKIFAPRFLLQSLIAIGSHVAAIVLERIV
ncbi:hypothetical protein BDF14DRAFT_1773147 [Spinellus fusiger]|nr:hypothetical protein BDF14DRAFT_1773147 [Spinellus fusiger]